MIWYRLLAKLVMNGSRGAIEVREGNRHLGGLNLPPAANTHCPRLTRRYRKGARLVLNFIFYHNCIYYNIIFENFTLGILRVRPAHRAGNSGGFETLYGDCRSTAGTKDSPIFHCTRVVEIKGRGYDNRGSRTCIVSSPGQLRRAGTPQPPVPGEV